MLFGVSVAVGLLMAVAYHGFMTRSQLWLSRHSGNALPVFSVASLFMRLTIVGALMLALHVYTPLDVLVVACAFVGLFTVLNVYALYRLAAGWNRPSGPSVQGSS